jgi:hypothetical protein
MVESIQGLRQIQPFLYRQMKAMRAQKNMEMKSVHLGYSGAQDFSYIYSSLGLGCQWSTS